jgi:Na+-transporting methylmalonyl-CoA/oxaloacetate decarboxylase gamma subunit
MGIFLSPLALGLYLESRWLTQAGFVILFMFILAAIGYEMQRWQRREEVRENMRRILEEREQQGME